MTEKTEKWHENLKTMASTVKKHKMCGAKRTGQKDILVESFFQNSF